MSCAKILRYGANSTMRSIELPPSLPVVAMRRWSVRVVVVGAVVVVAVEKLPMYLKKSTYNTLVKNKFDSPKKR